MALLEEVGEREVLTKVSGVITNNFAETPAVFSISNNVLVKPTLLDLYLNNISYSSIIENAGKITLSQSLETELPEIYKIITPLLERREDMLNINALDIAKTNGLTKNLGLL